MAPPPGASGNGRFLGQPRRVAAPITTAPEGSAWGPLLFGILLLGAVGWFAIKQYTPQIQEDLLRRSGDALDTAGYGDQAKVSIDGRNIVLEGNVATEADSENAVAAVAGTFGVRAVDNRLTVGEVTSVEPEVRNTPSLSVSKDGDAVVLSGTVSDQKFADAIKSSAIEQFGEGNVSGDVSVDETATNPGWMSAVSQVLPDLATIENGALSVDTDTLSLTGNAADEATKKAIGDKAASLLNGQLIVDNQIVAPEPAPEPEPAPAPAPVLPAFASVTETADQITLSGFLTQQNADAIASAYEEQGKPVINNITIDERADSPAWVNTFGQSDAALENVKDGRLTIARSGNVTVRGKVESDDLKASAGQQLAALFGPEHKIINALIVEPPPVVPTMTPFVAVTDNGDSLTLSGLLPENAAKTLLQSYRSGGSTVVDNIATDPRVMSPDWTENMGQALDSMTDIADAKLNIASSGELTARGLAQSEDAKQAAGTKLSALFGDSVSLRNEITVETPKIVEAPKPALSDVLARIDIAGIRFRSNSVELNGESIAILDQVANVLNDYESASIEIAGHTDSTGSPEYNLDLSANRATAVMQYLGTRGIAADRMSAKGYGPARPIATNDTSTGRAQNRRIEFTLTGE